MHEIFNITSGSSQKEVAASLASYALSSVSREDDRKVVRLLTDFGYKSFARTDPDQMYGKSSILEQAAFNLIGEVIDGLDRGSPPDRKKCLDLQIYARR